MRLSTAAKIALGLFLVVGTVHVRAQDDEDVEIFDVDEIVEEDEDYEIGPSSDIETAFKFVDYDDKKLELGEIIKVLFLVSNKGDVGFNVTHVMASLRSPYDYNYHIQNFSIMPVGVLVPPAREASFEYLFKPDPSLEPTEFWLTAEIFYNSSEDRTYKSAIFNGTVDLVEKSAEVDVRKFFKYLLVLAVFGAMGYGGYVMTVGGGKKKKKRTPVVKASTDEPQEEEVFELKQQKKGKDGQAAARRVQRRKSSKAGKKKK
mmetsp:Transcript_29920/g.55936  ORF Transcript_29920/g.55936 Transcript_29920/m.55936 type:complete len:260 (-) Transcript_29920:67-846(-)